MTKKIQNDEWMKKKKKKNLKKIQADCECGF